MSWRTVVITKRCKLDYKMGFMVIRDEDIKKVYLDEIAILLIENPSVSMTGCLLEELTAKKIKVIFCNSQRTPVSELIPLQGSHDSSRKIRTQVKWSDDIKGAVWADIVSEKIRKQAEFLNELEKKKEEELLLSYLKEVQLHDSTNREGHSAKVYFNAVFGMDFTRSADNFINSALNYGYSLILSAFNREVTANGYLTQLGIFHDNMFNHFNLSCDLMEPFRIIVDRKVKSMELKNFGTEEKHDLLDVLNTTVYIENSNQTVLNAIKYYTRSVFEALNDGDLSVIEFYKIV